MCASDHVTMNFGVDYVTKNNLGGEGPDTEDEEMLRIDRDDMFQLDSDNENQVTQYLLRLMRESEEDDRETVLSRVKAECEGNGD